MTLKVSAICTTEKTVLELTAAMRGLSGLSLMVHTGSVETLVNVLQRDHPDVLLLELPSHGDKEMERIETVLADAADVHVVLVSPDRSVEFLMQAMRAGVREVLPAPLTVATVELAVKHAHERLAAISHERSQLGQVLAVLPSKGGGGATFLATNLAYALSRQGKRVAVLDLNLHFGDAVIFLGEGVALTNLVELASKAEKLDAPLLESSMTKISDHLHILAAPESPEHVKEVSTTELERIIELARSSYDFVVLDISSMLEPLAVKALDLADTIYLVLQLSVPFVRAAKRMVSVFRELGYTASKIKVVVNRYEKNEYLGLDDVEKATQLQVFRTIPNSHAAVTSSINQGIPLQELAPRDSVARSLRGWAEELAPAAHKESGSWLSRWMERRA